MKEVEVTCAAFIPPIPVDWIWNGNLAAGKLTVMAGAPGTGKTLIALNCAAIVSNGEIGGFSWPDGTYSPAGNVLIWSGEDGVEDTIIPRLIAANANLSRVHVIGATNENGRQRPFNFEKDLPYLEEKLRQTGNVLLLIIDSIAQVVGGDSHKNSDVRRALEPLIQLAEIYGFAILGITHLTKQSKGKAPLDRVAGSFAFSAVARNVLMTTKVASEQLEDGSHGSVLVRAKSNLSSDRGGFLYETQSTTVMAEHRPIETARVFWKEALDGTAREILDWAEGGDSEPASGAVGQAYTFLVNQLANGPLPAKEVENTAASVGISAASLKRAKKAAGVSSRKTATYTLWELPSTLPSTMPALAFPPIRYDRSGNAYPFPNQQFNIAAMAEGTALHFAAFGRSVPHDPVGRVEHLDQVGPLGQLGSTPPAQVTDAMNMEFPAIPQHLMGVLTFEAHQSWYREGIGICRERFRLAQHQNALAEYEDQEDVFDIVRAVVDRVIDDLFFPDMENYNLLVEYYRAVFEDALNKTPGANY